MRVLIAGATGQTGRRLTEKLAQGDHAPVALVRESSDLSVLPQGCETRQGDLANLPENVTQGVDAVVFAAGSGADTSDEQTRKIDRDGAIALIDKAREAGLSRFVMLSSVGADQPEEGPDEMKSYLHAKHEADAYLKGSGLDYAIVRPVKLTTEEGEGAIELSTGHVDGKEISRDDVASVLAKCVTGPEASKAVFEIARGKTSIDAAISEI